MLRRLRAYRAHFRFCPTPVVYLVQRNHVLKQMSNESCELGQWSSIRSVDDMHRMRLG